jgi:hypothetical protein
LKPLQELAPDTEIFPLADEEPLTRQHVNAVTVTEPTFTLNGDVAITAKFIAEGLNIVSELSDAILI